MNWELIIVSICSVCGFFTFFDIFVYTIKKAPKSTFFGRKQHIIGLICIAVVVYYILNGYNLF